MGIIQFMDIFNFKTDLIWIKSFRVIFLNEIDYVSYLQSPSM